MSNAPTTPPPRRPPSPSLRSGLTDPIRSGGPGGEVTPTPDLAGRLRAFTLSDILQLLSFSGQTGTLTLTQGWNSRTIVFERGRLTYIAAATRLPSAGELLLRSGRLSERQLAQALADPAAAQKGLPAVLLHRGWATPDDLRRCRDQQLEETLYTLFLWRNCAFTFQGGVVEKADGLTIDLAAERLIIDGTRRVDEWMEISRFVPSLSLTFQQLAADWPPPLSPPSPQPSPTGSESQLLAAGSLPPLPRSAGEGPGVRADPTDALVFAAIDGRRDVIALARACNQTQFATARSLYRLIQRGAVRALPPDKLKIIQLFGFLVESIYTKLVLYGYARFAADFEEQLARFAADNGLKVRMQRGKIVLSDRDLPIDSTALIDLYKLFIAIQQNRFARMFEPQVVHGLTQGLYLHVAPELQELLRMYDFHKIEGLLGLDLSREQPQGD